MGLNERMDFNLNNRDKTEKVIKEDNRRQESPELIKEFWISSWKIKDT
jgi:hypothetical protein